jgi:hypothetical protein
MNMGIRLYKVPNKIREVGKIRQFKRVFRSYLVQQVFYSVEEYMLRLLVIGKILYVYICMKFPMSGA